MRGSYQRCRLVWGGHKTTAAFVAATGPRIEAHEPLLQSPLDGGVVTDLEMKTVNLLVASPVAPPEMSRILHAERHGYGVKGVTSMGTKQHHMVSESRLDQLIEKRGL